MQSEIHLQDQMIHSDLAGNFLFTKNKGFVIDISPGFFPKEYADTIMISDSIAWKNEPLESLELLQIDYKLKKELIIRAILFRTCTQMRFDVSNKSGFLNEYENFEKGCNKHSSGKF